MKWGVSEFRMTTFRSRQRVPYVVCPKLGRYAFGVINHNCFVRNADWFEVSSIWTGRSAKST